MIRQLSALLGLLFFAGTFLAGVLLDHPSSTRLTRSLTGLVLGAVLGALLGLALQKLVLSRLARDWPAEPRVPDPDGAVPAEAERDE